MADDTGTATQASDTGSKAPEAGTAQTSEKTFTQEDVNRFMADHKRNLQSQVAELDSVKQKLAVFEAKENELTQKTLEEQKNYEEAKKNLMGDVSKRDEIIKQHEAKIVDMEVNFALTGELSNQNAYIEEAMAVLRSQAVKKEDGTIVIKSKDSNGLDAELAIADGVKQFLDKRPYLVKATHKSGADTTTGSSGGAGSPGSEDLDAMNEQYMKLKNTGNHKAANEMKMKISSTLASRGITGQI